MPSLENKQRGMIELIMSTFVLIYRGVTLDLKDFAVHPSPFPQGTWYMIRANLSESLVNTREKLSKLDYLWWMVCSQPAITCSKSTIETAQQGVKNVHWTYFRPSSTVSVVDFEHVNASCLISTDHVQLNASVQKWWPPQHSNKPA